MAYDPHITCLYKTSCTIDTYLHLKNTFKHRVKQRAKHSSEVQRCGGKKWGTFLQSVFVFGLISLTDEG